MRMLYSNLLKCLMLFLSIVSWAPDASASTTMPLQTANDLFAAGNAFYRSQQFEEAQEAYRQLLDAGYNTAPVLYNLGTVHARLGNNTTASAYLMRARKLDPRNGDIRANLEFVLPKPEPDAAAADAGSVESLWSQLSGYLTLEEWLVIAWCALLLSCLAATAILLFKSERLRVLAKAATWSGLITLGFVAAPAITQYYKSRIATTSMVLSATEMLSGPGQRFTRVTNLKEGQILRDLGIASEGFRHVRLDTGLQGYVQDDFLMQI